MINPFVKWVGGKRSILPFLLFAFPTDITHYVEPFVGGGVVFLNTSYDTAHINDVNPKLITTYRAVRDNVEEVVDQVNYLLASNNRTFYLEQRRRFSTETNPVDIASLFIYLNKAGYNGMYRENSSGGFNVPYGGERSTMLVDKEHYQTISYLLQNVEITNYNFMDIEIRSDAFYYFDPPYHQTYNGYNKVRFDELEQQQLGEFVRSIDKCGGRFLLSNSDTGLIRDIYKGFEIQTVSSLRSVGSTRERRGRVDELLIRNYM